MKKNKEQSERKDAVTGWQATLSQSQTEEQFDKPKNNVVITVVAAQRPASILVSKSKRC